MSTPNPPRFAAPNLPSLRQLEYLVAVVELRHFTRAAAACFVTQPTLSAGIAELEAQLGVPVLERGRSGVWPTPLGVELAERARHILAATSDLCDRAQAEADPLSTTLRLGAIPTLAPFVFPRVVRSLTAAHPRLRLAVREDTSAQLLARLRDGRVDVAILALPFDTGELAVQPIGRDELVLALAPGRAAPEGGRLDPARLVLLTEGHCLREHTLVACGAAARAGELEASSLLTLVQMVAAGLGDALLPALALGTGLVESAGLQIHRLQPPPTRTIALVTRPSYTRPAVSAAVATALAGILDRPAAA
ncbi:MAG: LysR family transcriptional regulator [Deltaproteobacteria bacterium]|nr:LysR family transcriptional regulator [Deltaproteobacteria bacterium]